MSEGVIGHEAVRRQLEGGLPQTLYLRGVPGIGKRTLAEELARREVPAWSLLTVTGAVGVDRVREIQEFAQKRPISGGHKVLVLETDQMTEAAAHALLKLLEEPPATLKIVLVGGGRNIPVTVLSRCAVVECAPLAPYEVADVLMRLGLSEDEAEAAAVMGGGSVSAALEYHGEQEVRGAAIRAGHFILAGDFENVVKASRGWTERHVVWLRLWLLEWLMGRMGIAGERFRADDFPRATKVSADRLWALMPTFDLPMKPSLRALQLAAILGG